MLLLHFEGWFQCRLATNPDPTDERRGISGYTFALPGEPDFDRIIRLHDPVAPRSHGPEINVTVRSVFVEGRRLADHPLLGARVDLLDDPRFESRNRLLTDDRAGIGLLHPFHLQLTGPTVNLRRRDVLYPDHPGAPLHEVPPALLARRAPVLLDGMLLDPLRIAESTGITDPLAFRQTRKRLLEADLQDTQDAAARAALEKRIHELSIEAKDNLRVLALHLVQTRHFAINGPAEVHDPARVLAIDPVPPWPIEFWMGAWDADALCGFLSGRLLLPLQKVFSVSS